MTVELQLKLADLFGQLLGHLTVIVGYSYMLMFAIEHLFHYPIDNTFWNVLSMMILVGFVRPFRKV